MNAEAAKPRSKAEIVALLNAEGETFAAWLESLSPDFLNETFTDPMGEHPAHTVRASAERERARNASPRQLIYRADPRHHAASDPRDGRADARARSRGPSRRRLAATNVRPPHRVYSYDAGRPRQLARNNLAAPGSAAVLSVYAVGYVRTKPAATGSPTNRIGAGAAARAGDGDRARRRRPRREKPSAPKAITKKKKIAVDSVKAAPDSAVLPAPPALAPRLPHRFRQRLFRRACAARHRASRSPGRVYSGTSSRHGDIQAYVEIKGGKIASAFTASASRSTPARGSPSCPRKSWRDRAPTWTTCGATRHERVLLRDRGSAEKAK